MSRSAHAVLVCRLGRLVLATCQAAAKNLSGNPRCISENDNNLSFITVREIPAMTADTRGHIPMWLLVAAVLC